MARSITEIKSQITAVWMADAAVQETFNLPVNAVFEQHFKSVTVENIFFYCAAFGLWTLEVLFDAHKLEVLDLLLRMKPHSAAWYVTTAKAFQYGYDLLPDSDKFDNGTHTEDEILDSKIIKYAAAIERDGRLLLKVAKQDGSGDLQELEPGELAAFSEYINRVRDAGVVIELLTQPADHLKLEIDVFYNPLILNAQGQRIDGTAATPVRDAIYNYLANIEFDGTFVLAKMIDAIQQVEGVRFPHPKLVQARYGGLQFWDVQAQYHPLSGYIRILGENLTINYL